MTGELSTSTLDQMSATALPVTAPDIRALVHEHFAFIARSLRRLGVSHCDVDDASQQVFLVAAKKLDRIVGGNDKAFLFGIALRVASDSRRARRRRAVGEAAAAAESPTSVTENPEQIAANRQARALLDDILDTMPENIRAVFMLFELEEMTMAEIAKTLDVPPGSVASRLRRGRELFHSEAARLRQGTSGSKR